MDRLPMDLDARPFRAFVAVADYGSFSRAAEALHISQPALSAQVRELERRLGFTLFERTSRRVRLSGDGRMFLDKARRFVAENDWINQAAREIRTNQLRIGVAHFTAAIPERRTILEKFSIDNPAVPISVISRTPAQLLSELDQQDIDAAVLLEICGPSTANTAESRSEIQRLIIGRRPVRVAFAEAWPEGGLAEMAVANINRSHGVPLSEAIAHRLTEMGVSLIHLPEADAAALLHWGKALRKPVIELGWYDLPKGMTTYQIPDLNLSTQLSVLIRSGNGRRAVEQLAASLSGGSCSS